MVKYIYLNWLAYMHLELYKQIIILKNIFLTICSYIWIKNRDIKTLTYYDLFLFIYFFLIYCFAIYTSERWTTNPRMHLRYFPDSASTGEAAWRHCQKTRENSAIIVQHWSRKSAEVAVGAARLLLSFRLKAWRKDCMHSE